MKAPQKRPQRPASIAQTELDAALRAARRLETNLAADLRLRLNSPRMLAVESKPHSARSSASPPLPLESGEFMHAREFLRRYEQMPQVKKAELIEGVVYMGSPVSTKHAIPDGIIHGWLALYAAHNPGVQFMPNATVILDAENTVQPDALLRRLPEQGGLTRVTDDGYLAGPPELVVEVAVSSASIDLRDKRRAYCRNGVREYIVWRVAAGCVDWFCLEDDEYVRQAPDAQGMLDSRVFPGLRLPVAGLLAYDTAEVLAALAEHEPRNGNPPETSVKSKD